MVYSCLSSMVTKKEIICYIMVCGWDRRFYSLQVSRFFKSFHSDFELTVRGLTKLDSQSHSEAKVWDDTNHKIKNESTFLFLPH